MVDIAKLAIEVDSSQALSASKNLDAMSQSSGRAEKATKASGTAAQNSSYKYRMAAMQLSQVASQGSVTGNYLQALAIQLPDLALGFGTLGIVIGSVAGALAVPLFDALTGASVGVDELTADLDALSGNFETAADGSYKLSEELVRLAQISEQAAKLKVAVETESARRNLLELGSSMRETFDDLTGDQMLSALDKLEGVTISDKIAEELRITTAEASKLQSAVIAAVQSRDVKDYSNFADVLGELSGKYGRNNRDLMALVAGMSEFIEAGAMAADNYSKLKNAGTDWSELLKRTNEDNKKTSESFAEMAEAVSFYEEFIREQLRMDSARVQSRADSMKAVSALESSFMTDQERLKDTYLEQKYAIADALAQEVINVEEANNLKLESDKKYYTSSYQMALRDAQQREALNASMVSSAQSLNNNLVAALEEYGRESSNLGKVAIAVQKGIMVAQAVMGANMAAIQTQVAYAGLAAATLNPALIEVGAARAEIIRGMGYASAALIAATEFAPARALGGQVKAGQSYMVGERGPEMITMGSDGHITSNAKMNSGPAKVEVINNGQPVTATASMDGDTMKIILDAAEERINSNIARGGSTARVMQGAYGLRRSGR